MSDRIPALDSQDGYKRVLINRRWVDNPAIRGGRYVSQRPKTSRTKREPVETKVAVEVADPAISDPHDAGSTKETQA